MNSEQDEARDPDQPAGSGVKREKTQEMSPREMDELVSHNVLLVDDDQFLLEFFERVLTAHGYKIITARNGHEGAEIVAQAEDEIDLFVLDLLMPVESGWDLINAIRQSERYKNAPIIALTGLSLAYDEFERLGEKVDAVMLKGDFDVSRFTETIAELLHKSTAS